MINSRPVRLLIYVALAALASCLVPAYGCVPPDGTTPANDGSPIDWPSVLECGPDGDDIVAEISSILQRAEVPGQEAEQVTIGDRAKSELEDLARRYGPDVVACLIDLQQREWTRPGGSVVPERFAAAQRASSFLEEKGVKVTANEAFKP